MARGTPERAVRDRYHHGDLKRALVAAALDIVREQDVASVSLREVARRAGVSPAAPYHHFRDKSLLLAEVAQEGFRLLTSRMRQALEQSPRAGGPERLARLGRAYVRFATEEPAHYRVMFSPELAGGEAEQRVHPAGMEALHLLTSQVQAQLPRAMPDQVIAISVTLWAGCHGLASLLSDGVLRRKADLPLPAEEVLVRAVSAQLARLVQEAPDSAAARRPRRQRR
jgi:AcrR family transcriptional regulator